MEAGLQETFGEDLHRGQIRGHHADNSAHHNEEGAAEDVQSELLLCSVALILSCSALICMVF